MKTLHPTALRILAAILAFTLCGRFAPQANAAEQPNVVMLISDDQAWGDCGFMVHPAIKTPHQSDNRGILPQPRLGGGRSNWPGNADRICHSVVLAVA